MTSAREDRAGRDRPRVSVIVVTYNSEDHLVACVEAVRFRDQPFEVIVVDNRSTDGTRALLERLSRSGGRFRVILNASNVGFGEACNQAASVAEGEYLLFLNPDAVAKARAIEAMAAYLDAHRAAGVLGPRITLPDGALQLSCGQAPRLRHRLFDALRFSRLLPSVFGGYRLARWEHDEARDVDWVAGGCLMIRAELFRPLLGFDEHFFLFEEDVDLCVRARRAGWRVVYWPEVTVVHAWGQSRKSVRVFSDVASYRAKVYFSRKHGGRLEAALLACAFPLIGLAKSAVLYAGSLLPGPAGSRAGRREAARAQARIVRALTLGRGAGLDGTTPTSAAPPAAAERLASADEQRR